MMLYEEKNIEIIYKDLNPKSMILFFLGISSPKLFFQNLNKLMKMEKCSVNTLIK